MDNLIFSLNVTIPIFLVILLGYILRQKNFLTQEFVNISNKYVFSVALPVMLFLDVSAIDVRNDMNPKFFIFCMTVTVFMFLASWGLSYLFIKDKTIVGAFAQASVRGSAAILGMAFVMNICGEAGMTPLMIVAAVPLFNMLSVIILVFCANNEPDTKRDYGKIKNSIINIAKNPIIIGILLGLISSLLNIKLPAFANKAATMIGNTATPIALLAIGGGFDTKQAITKLKPSLIATFIKLIFLPMIFLPLAYAFGFRDSEMVAVLIMLASPTTVSCYVMAKNMHNDDVLTADVIVLTTLISSVTLTLWIFILRTLGCI